MHKKQIIAYFFVFTMMFNILSVTIQNQEVVKPKTIAQIKRELKIKQNKLKKALAKQKAKKITGKPKPKPASKPKPAKPNKPVNPVIEPITLPINPGQGKVGDDCKKDEDCYLNNCVNNKCAPTTTSTPGKVGDDCKKDEDCYLNNCVKKKCAAPSTVIVEPGGSSTSTLDEVKKWGSLVSEFGGAIATIPTIIAISYWLMGKYDAAQLGKILLSSNKMNAVRDILIENGHIDAATNVETFNNLVLNKVKTFAEGIKSLKKNGINVSTKNLEQIRVLIENPELIAQDLNISIPEAKQLQSAILEKISPTLDKLATKISEVDLSKLTDTQVSKFEELQSQFDALLNPVDPMSLSLDPALTPAQANAEINSMNAELEGFAPVEVMPTEVVQPLPEGLVL